MSASFDSYRIFYYVGKYKNITHAASALFLSQSTVSRSIQSLEAELGCKLFYRTQQGVAFTVEGDILFGHISKACEQIFLGEEKVMQMQQLTRGSLKISVSDFTFDRFVLPVMRSFHEEFPSVEIEIISASFGDSESVVASLSSGKAEIACSAATFTDVYSKDVDITPVSSYTDAVMANRKFQELKYGSHYFTDLTSYPFASLTGYSQYMSYLDKLFLAHGMDVTPTFKVDSMDMFISIVKTCPCLAIVPTLFRSEFSDGDAFEVSMEEPMSSHTVSILTSNTAPQSAARDAFVKSLRKYISAACK